MDDDFIIGSMLFLMAGAAWYHSNKRRVQKKTKTRVRRFKVRPINRKRKSHSQYHFLVKLMESQDEEQFFKYTRMNVAMYNDLLKLVAPRLLKDPRGDPLSPSHKLTMTLHYLSSGSSMQEIAWSYHVGKATVHFVVTEVCEALWDMLQPIVFPQRNKEYWYQIAKEFFRRWNFPNCFGAVDGKHISIQSPKYSGSEFFNYKKTFSIILMATCDSYYKFTEVDIGAAGSNTNGSVFRGSKFGKALMGEELDLPEDKELLGTNIKMPFFLVADQAFPLHKRIMRPYPGNYLGEKNNVFNMRLSRARRTIENTFGILVQRWRILRGAIIANVDHIVAATVVLHNFIQKGEEEIPVHLRRYCPTGYTDHINDNNEEVPGSWRQGAASLRPVTRLGSNNAATTLRSVRDKLTDYLVSDEGQINRQWNIVNRGGAPNEFRRNCNL